MRAELKQTDTADTLSEAEARKAAAEWLRTQTEGLRKRGDERAQTMVREAVGEAERRAAKVLDAKLAEQAERLTKEALQEREQRFEEIETRIGTVGERAEAVVERAHEGGEAAGPGASPPAGPAPTGAVSLNLAELDDLLGLGMSVTQAERVLSYREEHGGFGSLEELAEVPGLPEPFLDQVRGRLVP